MEPAMEPASMIRPVVHFVGFSDDRYWNAVRIWGEPAFIHRGWDRRARRDIAAEDVVIFATGSEDQEPRARSFDDIHEQHLG